MDIAKRPKVAVQLNIAPLIDIVFLLLIFFMLTSTFLKEQALDIHLPQSETGETSNNQQALQITAVDIDSFLLDGQSMSLNALKEKLSALNRSLPEAHPVIVRIDNTSEATMETVQQAGFTNVALATEKK
ncbi:biopolymer transporter ExbD [bacterium]|nr:biopolymer transporter ExbD [bacterium]